jgi:hypothetical protein
MRLAACEAALASAAKGCKPSISEFGTKWTLASLRHGKVVRQTAWLPVFPRISLTTPFRKAPGREKFFRARDFRRVRSLSQQILKRFVRGVRS